MKRDYEIVDSENGIVREIKESPFIVGESGFGIYINPKSELYQALIMFYKAIQEAFNKVIEENNKNT